MTMLHSAVFQSIASMAIPTLVIHTVVHQSHSFLHRAEKLPRIVRSYGPSGVGLCCIPLLPVIFLL